MGEHDEQFIFEMGYNKGFKDGIKGSIPKSDYETRLKADMVAMLTDIQLEIEELYSMAGYDGRGMPTFSTDYIRKNKVNELIQQKINSLKENTNADTNN